MFVPQSPKCQPTSSSCLLLQGQVSVIFEPTSEGLLASSWWKLVCFTVYSIIAALSFHPPPPVWSWRLLFLTLGSRMRINYSAYTYVVFSYFKGIKDSVLPHVSGLHLVNGQQLGWVCVCVRVLCAWVQGFSCREFRNEVRPLEFLHERIC